MDANSHEAGGIFDCACTDAPTLLKPERGPRPLSLRPDLLLDARLRAVGRSGAHDLSRQSSVRQGATAVRINLREDIPPIFNLRTILG